LDLLFSILAIFYQIFLFGADFSRYGGKFLALDGIFSKFRRENGQKLPRSAI
jgi:hypothetical protein